MFTEDNLLPISALQHLLFCERQCALIHIERLWAENRLTVEGRHLHDKVHDGQPETRAGVCIARAVPLRSLRLGLFGAADVVEFHAVSRNGRSPPPRTCACAEESSTGDLPPSVPFPIEYKRGRPKKGDFDRVQVCAQALCLEEMFNVQVSEGALFYGRTHRREAVVFDPRLRRLTEQTAARLHELIATGSTPPASRAPKCKRCSLVNLCLPRATDTHHSALRYVRRALAAQDAGVSGGAESGADDVPDRPPCGGTD